MSLISFRNFAAPFKNTVHLVTIFLAAVLFAFFRFQNGSASVSFNGNSNRNASKVEAAPKIKPGTGLEGLLNGNADRSATSAVEAAPRKPAAARFPDKGTIRLSPGEEKDLLGQMIGQKPLPKDISQEEVKRNNVGTKNDNGGLDDIEKQLGLK